jgi:hypothetical protein
MIWLDKIWQDRIIWGPQVKRDAKKTAVRLVWDFQSIYIYIHKHVYALQQIVSHIQEAYCHSTTAAFWPNLTCAVDGRGRQVDHVHLANRLYDLMVHPQANLREKEDVGILHNGYLKWCSVECPDVTSRWMFPECSLNVPWMFPECSLNVPWRPNMASSPASCIASYGDAPWRQTLYTTSASLFIGFWTKDTTQNYSGRKLGTSCWGTLISTPANLYAPGATGFGQRLITSVLDTANLADPWDGCSDLPGCLQDILREEPLHWCTVVFSLRRC